MKDRLVKMILEEVEHCEKKRWEVTNRLRNHTREQKAEAIKHCTSTGLVYLSDGKSGSPGRTPTYVFITAKGVDELKLLRETVNEFGIWGS